MTSIIISYSRQELTFVESLTQELIKHRYDTWVDFRKLVPGISWQSQIDSAIDNAEVLLLIISHNSVNSAPVYHEWTKAFKEGKRIILIIFEAVELSPTKILLDKCNAAIKGGTATSNLIELGQDKCQYGWDMLAQCEWIDFRKPFKESLGKLENLLQSPSIVSESVPQSGFQMPPITKMFWLLSFVVALSSIPFVFPAIRLVPLIRRFPQRTYRYSDIQFHLIFLAIVYPVVIFALLANSFIFYQVSPTLRIFLLFFSIVSTAILFICIGLFMYSPALYQWAPPSGARIRTYVNHPKINRTLISILTILAILVIGVRPEIGIICLIGVIGFWLRQRRVYLSWLRGLNDPTPVKVTIDYEYNDRQITNEIINELQKTQNQYVTFTRTQISRSNIDAASIVSEPETVLVLLSRFKHGSVIDPEKAEGKNLIPVILDDTDFELIQEKFLKLQLIDLRQGMPNKIKILARLVSNPQLLMETLGTLPIANIKRPTIVGATINFCKFLVAWRIMGVVIFFISWLLLWTIPNSTDYAMSLGSIVGILLSIGVVIGYSKVLRDIQNRADSTRTRRLLLLMGFVSIWGAVPGGALGVAGGIFGLVALFQGIFLYFSKDIKLWLSAD